MSHIANVSDAVRARELYKYYQPKATSTKSDVSLPIPDYSPPDDPESFNELNVSSNVSSSKISSPDTALTAFSQLVSWRTGAQRAMISVIDVDTQHFIAESTRTLDLVDNTRHSPGDGLWIGCGEVSKAGRLCERTIALPPAAAGKYAAFIISDLSSDDRFNQLPFVSGPPFLKFYAGTPLITKRGIPIGSLFIVDDRARAGLSEDEIHFMGTMAGTIMGHMEMVREVEQHRRGMKMSRGLASFVEGRTQLIDAEVNAPDEEGTMVAGQFEIGSVALPDKSPNNSSRNSIAGLRSEPTVSIERKEKEYSSGMLKAEEAIMNSAPGPDAGVQVNQDRQASQPNPATDSAANTDASSLPMDSVSTDVISPASVNESEASMLKMLFSRAANLIREAFEVDGGSVFYDAQRGFGSDFSSEHHNDPGTSTDDLSLEDSRSNSDSGQTEEKDYSGAKQKARSSPPPAGEAFRRTSTGSDKAVEILGFSTPTASSVNGDEHPGVHSFVKFDEKSLHGFLRKYPRGKLWTFDQDGFISSSEEDVTIPPQKRGPVEGGGRTRRTRTAAEAAALLRHFPGVRQLLFVPLWDAARSRWLSGNFTWSTEATHILSKQNELAFLTAFGNSVMAECSRLDTEIADQKKGDFIGSISHELRSPLHGILASAEFLGEEVTGAFARGLVETIDSCGRTLLDTINHILDFSKINHLEKNWRRSRRIGSSISRPGARTANSFALRKADLPMINLFADVDISIVCEEVVEGVFAGHVFQNVTAPSFDKVAGAGGKMSDNRQYLTSPPMIDSEEVSHFPSVAVILDIDVNNYHFTTQPGALRRVIMNLLGNALKYTSRGYVKIKLESTDLEDLHPAGSMDSVPRACVTLTVTDTGKGISSDFIRSKLFTPFAQENSLSSGTGLGLSIVRSIVALLEGEISIMSELGRGTEVKVTLPLLREFPQGGDSSGSTPKSMSSLPKELEEVIDLLRPRVFGKSVALRGFSGDPNDPISLQTNQLLKTSIKNFLVNWYGLRLASDKEKVDILIVNEPSPTDVVNLGHARRGNKRGPVILALCSHSSRFDRQYANNDKNADVGFLAKPIGPLKLARAISQCLDGIPITTTPALERGLTLSANSTGSGKDLTNNFEDLSLSPNRGEILDNSRMAADSENARKVLESPTPTPIIEKQEFPFPVPIDKPKTSVAKVVAVAKQDSELMDPIKDSGGPIEPTGADGGAKILTTEGPASVLPYTPSLPVPRLLLVDDNKINLRLLRMYMRKRNYSDVDEAENGLEAVDAMKNHEQGYDIIFMDISMPVLDGFGATRQIRQIERVRKEKAIKSGEPPAAPALVIALTGLASSKDQSEAFTSGVDLFLTKPVAFKEVGKMLDNWEANREQEAMLIKETPATDAANPTASTDTKDSDIP